MKLLTIDWDYFFPVQLSVAHDPHWYLYDWSHNENHSPAIQNMLWLSRAAAFLRLDMDIPTTSGDEVGFWDRFMIRPKATVFVSDSHMHAVNSDIWEQGISTLWLYDAHHDCGYVDKPTPKQVADKGLFDCGNWMIAYDAIGAELHMRYPSWKTCAFDKEPAPKFRVDRKFDDGEPNEECVFDIVHVCRSGAWSPPWVDDKFDKFIQEIAGHKMHRVKYLQDVTNRGFDIDEARYYARMLNKVADSGRKFEEASILAT